MICLITFAFFICSVCTAWATDREFGHPLFRTFTARDYGEVRQIFSVTEDAQGRLLFGCEDAILAIYNNYWETIPIPGTGFNKLLAGGCPRGAWFRGKPSIRNHSLPRC